MGISRPVSFRDAAFGLCLGAAVCLTTVACGGQAGERSPTLRVALSADPQCIDPHQAPHTESLHVGRQFVDNLTYQDPETGEVQPWIAKTWTVSEDATRFTFTIRDDATFSNGDPVDAAAVAANFEDLRALGAKSPFGNSYTRHLISAVAADPHTVVFTFDAPSSQFLQATSMVTTGLLAGESLTRTPEERCAGVIGSGPFVLENFEPNSSASLVARPDYHWSADGSGHSGPAEFAGIEFTVMPESAVRSGALQSGQIDVDTDVRAQDEEVLEGQGFALISRPRPGVGYTLLANEQSPALADPRVRNAITHGIDRTQFTDVLSPRETYARNVLSASTPYFSDESGRLTHDPAAAGPALDAAGWTPGPDGIRVRDGKPLTLRLVYSSTDTRTDVYQVVQQQLLRIGVNLELVPLAAGPNTEAQKTGDYDFVSWAATRPDPEVLVTLFGTTGSNPNRRTVPERIDELLDRLGRTTDPAARQSITTAAAGEVIDQGHGIPLFEQSTIIATSPGTQGVVLDASSRPNFYGTRIDR